jgi:hypothetical protein
MKIEPHMCVSIKDNLAVEIFLTLCEDQEICWINSVGPKSFNYNEVLVDYPNLKYIVAMWSRSMSSSSCEDYFRIALTSNSEGVYNVLSLEDLIEV